MKITQNKIMLVVAGILVATTMGGCGKTDEAGSITKSYPKDCWKSRQPPALMAKVEHFLKNKDEARAALDACYINEKELNKLMDEVGADKYFESDALVTCIAARNVIKNPVWSRPCQ